MEQFFGEIRLFAGNFPPQGWAFCWGQIIPVQQNPALYSLLGNYYGGVANQSFALPDLRGRACIGFGQGPGLTPRQIGVSSGEQTVTLTPNQIPPHNHPLMFVPVAVDTQDPSNHFIGFASSGLAPYAEPTGRTQTQMGDGISPTGGGAAHDNMPPYLVLNYIIATEGEYPDRP